MLKNLYLFFAGIVLTLLVISLGLLMVSKGKTYASKQSLESIATLSVNRIEDLNNKIHELKTKQEVMEMRLTTLEGEVDKWQSLLNKAMGSGVGLGDTNLYT